MHCRSPTLRFCEKNLCSYAPFGLLTEAVQLTQFRHMPNQPNAAPRTPWFQAGVFTAAFLLLQSGWSLARGTALERISINISWNVIDRAVSISVGVSSDLPDAVTANNTAVIQVALVTGCTGDTDAPTLPQWGMLLLGALLIGCF